MPALEAIISANSEPYARELRAVEGMAQKAGVTISKGIGEGAELTLRPMLHLKEVVGKLFQGNVEGALFPAMMLAGHFGLLKGAISSTAEEEIKLSVADQEAAKSAWIVATASTRKAQASAAAFAAAEGEAEAELEVAVADEKKAAADIMVAIADDSKAASSLAAAGAAQAEAASFVTVGGIILGVAAAVIGAIILWQYRIKMLADAMSEVNLPDTVANDVGRLNAYELGWRKIAEAIRDASAAMNSANEAFAVSGKILEKDQQTERTILDSQRNQELERAGDDPAKRMAIMEKYAKAESDMEKKQAAEKLALDAEHIKGLQREQDEKTKMAQEIQWTDKHGIARNVMTEADEQNQKANLEKYHDALNKPGKDGKTEAQKAQEKLDQHSSYVSGTAKEDYYSQDELTAAQSTVEAGKRFAIRLNEFNAAKGDREKAREEQKELFDEAATAGADKITAAKKYNEALFSNQRNQKEDDRLRAVKLDEEGNKRMPLIQGELTNYQKVGAYAGSSTMLDLQRRSANHLESIDAKVTPKTGTTAVGSSVRY